MTVPLSVVLCAYNEERHLPDQLAAILDQMLPEDDLVLVNDGSEDGTGWMLLDAWNAWRTRGGQAVFERHPEPWGVARAYNAAAHSAKAPWLCLVSANDQMLEGALAAHRWGQEQADKWRAPLVTGYGSEYRLPYGDTRTYYNPGAACELFRGGGLHGCATSVRKDAFLGYGGFPEDLGPFGDYWLFHTMAMQAGFVFVPHAMTRADFSPGRFSDKVQDPAYKAAAHAAFRAHLIDPAYQDVLAGWMASRLLYIPDLGPELYVPLQQEVVGVA